jgi:hypothetical protein
MLVLAVVVGALDHQLRVPDLGTAGLCVTFGLMGLIVAWHQPRNPMGWVLPGVAFFYILDALAGSYAVLEWILAAPAWPPIPVLMRQFWLALAEIRSL